MGEKIGTLSMEHASATYPGPSPNTRTAKYSRRRSPTDDRRLIYKGRNGSRSRRRSEDDRRHHSETSDSSEDKGYSTSESKEPERGADRNVVYIPVEMTPEEKYMMDHAESLEETLRKSMTQSEMEKMFRLLQEHSSEMHLNETTFMENMKRILNAKKYEKIEVFLKSYWNLKEPLLRKSFKIAQTDKGFDSRLNLL